MAHTLGIKVVSEGIEKMTQLEQLNALGCEFGQGFLFSRPLNPESAELIISSSTFPTELGQFESRSPKTINLTQSRDNERLE